MEKERRPIRFFCYDCGTELWELVPYSELDGENFTDLVKILQCSDCLLAEIKAHNIPDENEKGSTE